MLSRLVPAVIVAAAAVAPLAGLAPAPRTDAAPVTIAAPTSFKVDAVHSKALFRVKHLGASHFYGRFNEVAGTFSMDTNSNAPIKFDLSIPVASVDTGNENLDNHLKSPDFFNAREFEAMTFLSSGIEKSGAGAYAVTGDLTIHGVTKQVTATVEFVGATEISPRMGFRSGYETSFTIDRTDFGMDYGVDGGMLGSDVKVIVSLEGIRTE